MAQSPPPPTVEQVVERAQRYVAAYGTELAPTIGVERYTQRVANSVAGAMAVASGERPWTRETVAEFALVPVNDAWLGYRDVFEVDGKSVADRHDRLSQLFMGAPATAIEQGRKIADESARYNAGAVQRNFNVPTMALMFLHPSHAGRCRFERAGSDTINGTPVWKIRYRETREPTMIRTSEGANVRASGIFWIDPVLGRVWKSSLEVKGVAELDGGSSAMPESFGAKAPDHDGASERRVDTYSRVTTLYALDARLGLLVPSEMTEEHQGLAANRATGRDRVIRISCRATYSEFKKFDASGRLIQK